MKVSVSLPDDDLSFLDTYVREYEYDSRSSALHHAVNKLRAEQLAAAYEDAWGTWAGSGEHEVWDVAVSDGLEN
jgi:Arc/MetJ-type ribon-helix-helix transcriptional regulator